jgi:hypothetical protein
MPSENRLLRRAGLLLLLAPLLAAACFGPDRHAPDPPDAPDHPESSDGAAPGDGIHEGVEGRVTAPGPKPLEGVAVRPRSLDEPAAAIPEMAVVSEDDGHYSWTLRPGEYEISFVAAGYRPATRRVTVHPRQTARLDVTLQPAR